MYALHVMKKGTIPLDHASCARESSSDSNISSKDAERRELGAVASALPARPRYQLEPRYRSEALNREDAYGERSALTTPLRS